VVVESVHFKVVGIAQIALRVLDEVLGLAGDGQLPRMVGVVGGRLGAQARLASVASLLALFVLVFLVVLVTVRERWLAEKSKAVRLDGVGHGDLIVHVSIR